MERVAARAAALASRSHLHALQAPGSCEVIDATFFDNVAEGARGRALVRNLLPGVGRYAHSSVAAGQARATTPGPVVLGASRTDNVCAQQGLRGPMVEHCLIPEGHALERQGLELGNLLAELTVVDVHMELQRLVPGQCRSGTRRRRGRAEMMPAVGHPNQRTGPSARSCSRQSVAGRRRRVQQQTTVIEAHDRRASAQPRTAEPNGPLQRPDPVIDYGGESTLEHAGDRLLAAQLPNAMLAHVHTSDIVPRAIQAETRTPAAGVREEGPDQTSHPSKPATQRPLRAAQRAASLTDPPLGPSPGAAAKKRARIRGLFF